MENNSVYQRIKEKHPDWSDEQIWTAASLDMQADVVIDQKGKDVSVNDPDIMEMIIRGAMDWLDEALPLIFENNVKQATVWLHTLSVTCGDTSPKGRGSGETGNLAAMPRALPLGELARQRLRGRGC